MIPGHDGGGTPAEPDPPRTLAEAHEAMATIRPRQRAPLAEWLTYHQRSAAWYAEVDRGHHHEALFMAERERQRVKEIKIELSSQQVASGSERGGEMAVRKVTGPGPPQTLMQAHEELVRTRPCLKASLAVWLSYYQWSVQVYEQIAKIDPGHECEALYWAQRERVHARRIEARISAVGLSE